LGDDRIDKTLLPKRVLVDSSVLIMALGDHADDQRAPICVALWDALIQADAQILIAAPSVAELLRSEKKTPLPRTVHVQVVAFDLPAAEILADKLPQRILKAQAVATGDPLQYIKYDAMIVACALRHRAESVITYDGQMVEMCRVAAIRSNTPQDFRDQQTDIFRLFDENA